MKRIDAIWEKENIGSRVLEITVEPSDSFDSSNFDNIPLEYDCIVVKVPTNKTEFNWYLGGKGFTMIETHIRLCKDIKDFDKNDRYIRKLLPYVSYKIIDNKNDLGKVLSRITPDMFVTDRISLDPHYGPNNGCTRYKNYIRSSFESKKLEIVGLYFKKELVGFDMHSIEDGVCYGKLGGLFNDIKIPGIGFLTACAPLLFSYETYGVTKFVPEISTNNIPVLNLYDYFHYNVVSMRYVFVKHNYNIV